MYDFRGGGRRWAYAQTPPPPVMAWFRNGLFTHRSNQSTVIRHEAFGQMTQNPIMKKKVALILQRHMVLFVGPRNSTHPGRRSVSTVASLLSRGQVRGCGPAESIIHQISLFVK